MHPLRGQNNVQGASDAGLIPMFLPDYQSVMDDGVRSAFTDVWGSSDFSAEKGLTVVEIMDAVHAGDIRGMYILGENPAMSDPDVEHARDALAKLEHLVVQDIFLTETANYADVILPASAWAEKTGTVTNTNRQVQMGRPAIAPPGDARGLVDRGGTRQASGSGLDLHASARGFCRDEAEHGLAGQHHLGTAGTETRSPIPSLSPKTPGSRSSSATVSRAPEGRAKFTRRHVIPPDEVPDADYPDDPDTGRQLEHWHTGSMTRRATVLDGLEPEANCSLHPAPCANWGGPGEMIALTTRGHGH